MRRIILLSILGLLAFTGFGQESNRKNALSIALGSGYLARQDLTFSPVIHNDLSLLNIGFSYEGIGLAPDVYSKNTLPDITAGIDKTLQLAIDQLK